jgi:hypothetical protein
MSSREPSWRRVAEVLADRVWHAAGAAGSLPNTHTDTRYTGPGCSHGLTEADPDNCPFCADRAAYQLFERKLRSTTNPPEKGTP